MTADFTDDELSFVVNGIAENDPGEFGENDNPETVDDDFLSGAVACSREEEACEVCQ
jgi:hypothetical protein